MFILVAYDVNTETKEGRRRLRRVAKICQNHGQRVQLSVFECLLTETKLIKMKADLIKEIDDQEDSLRIYFINEADKHKIEHFGIKKPRDLQQTLIF